MTTVRQQIIEKTSELLDRQGYHATGLNQIVAESETPRGSLYYYFPDGKEELAAEAIEDKARKVSEHTRRSLATDEPAVDAIYHFVLSLADHAESEHCAAGAPVAAVALETATTSARLQRACQAAYKLQQAPFEERLLAGGFAPQSAHDLAVTISAALEGGFILSRTEHTSQPLRIIAEAIKQLLRCAAPTT
jgi:TetR/AcrR family transcriptional repressor of lmrAB and yxaGH operons